MPEPIDVVEALLQALRYQRLAGYSRSETYLEWSLMLGPRPVDPADLAGEKFIAFDRDLAVRKAIDRTLKQHGVKVDVVMEFDNVETIKQAIGIAAGVSILPRPTVVMESGMRTLATVPLVLAGLARPIGLIYRRGKRLTPAVARFIETLRKADESPSSE